MHIIIKDCFHNGKANILNYPTYYIDTLFISNNKLLYKNSDILKGIKTIIFDFNEALLFFPTNLSIRFHNKENLKKYMIDIYNFINENYNITIYNRPDLCYIMGDKNLCYNLLQQNALLKNYIPKYISFNNINDINKIDFEDVIFKETIGSNSKYDFICKKNEIHNNIYPGKKYIASEFIDTYIPELQTNNMIRFMIINNTLIDFHFISSEKKNIHPIDQNMNKFEIGNTYFSNILNNIEIQKIINSIYSIFGNCIYVIDAVLTKDNKLYICELGLKFFMDSYISHIKKYNTKINKISFDKKKLINFYMNIIES